MNIIDILILAVLGVSLIFGLYRGFISGVLSVAALIGAAAAAFAVSPSLAAWLQGNDTLVNTLMYYTDAGSRIKDLDLSLLTVSQVTQGALTQIMAGAQLPEQFQAAFINAVNTAPGATTMATLLSQTIVNVGGKRIRRKRNRQRFALDPQLSDLLSGLLHRRDVRHPPDLLCVRAAGAAPSGRADGRRVRAGARRAAAVHPFCARADHSGGRAGAAAHGHFECVAPCAAV